MSKVRLLKVVVQPVVVIDDGERLEERVVEPVTIGAADWPEFSAHGIEDGLGQLQAQIDAEGEVPPAARPLRPAAETD